MAEHGDAVADGVEAVEVVGDHEDGEPERLLQRADEIVEIAGRDRIEPGGRLIEEHDLRVEGERSRQRDALRHAARQLGGEFVGRVLRESDQFEFLRHQPVEGVLRKV